MDVDLLAEASKLMTEAERQMREAIGKLEEASSLQAAAFAMLRKTVEPLDITPRERALRAEIERLRQTVVFFASVIRSGDSWSSTCQAELDQAMGRPVDVNSPEAALWSENMRLKSRNEFLEAREALSWLDRRSRQDQK